MSGQNLIPLDFDEREKTREVVKINISRETKIFLLKFIEAEEELGKNEQLIISFKDLKIDDHVLVSTKNNIEEKKEFFAEEITVIEHKQL